MSLMATSTEAKPVSISCYGYFSGNTKATGRWQSCTGLPVNIWLNIQLHIFAKKYQTNHTPGPAFWTTST